MRKTKRDANALHPFSFDPSKTGKRAQLRVALVYPNSYAVGMDNLGFQGIYGLIVSDPRVRCERFFFEASPRGKSHGRGSNSPAGELRSFESNLPLKSFDVIAFSVSFENDYLNLLKILKASGIEPFASKRDDPSPFLLAGGVGVFMNPEPVSPFMDAIFLGEADEAMGEIVDAFLQGRRGGRQSVLESLAGIDGVYVPSLHSPFLRASDAPVPSARVTRRHVSQLSTAFRSSVISTSRSHLGGMVLVESGRGCSRKCRFCAVTSAYAPLRFVPAESLLARIEEGAPARGSVGIVGACVSEHPGITELARALVGKGLRISLSSMRADATPAELVELIARSGTKTITTAPEAGTARLRRVINKELDETKLFELVEVARDSGIASLKLYFVLGLPSEKPEDIEAIVSLVGAIRTTFLSGNKTRKIIVSASPFVPKAVTPFQWCRMLDRDSMNRKIQTLAKGLSRMSGVKLGAQSARASILEGALSRGDWRVAEVLNTMVYEGLNLKQAWGRVGLRFEDDVFEERDTGAPLPWDHLLIGPAKAELKKELDGALKVG